MAANTQPIFTLSPKIGQGVWLPATTANTKSDGTGTIGTDMLNIFTAGADGSFINKVRANPQASVAGTSTTATTLRLYLSTVGSGATTNADTTLIGEVGLSSQSADNASNATSPVEVQLGFPIPTGYYILASLHHASAANTSWGLVCIGGDY